MKAPLAILTAVGVAAALAWRERVDQRVLNMAQGRGFIRDGERPTAGPEAEVTEPTDEPKKKGKKVKAV